MATTVLAMVFSGALGRTLGASDLGLYYLIGSFAGFAFVLADGGQQTYVTREIARRTEQSSLFLGTALVLRAAGVSLVTILSGVAVWALGYDAITCLYTLAFIAVCLPFVFAQAYGMVFRASDRMDFDAWVSVANKIASLGFALAVLALGKGLPGVLAAQALAGLLALAVAIWLYRRAGTGPLRYDPEVARKIVAGGAAVFTAGLTTAIHPYMNAVMLSKLAPADVVGWYAAANTIFGTLIAPSLIIATASFPRTLARSGEPRQVQGGDLGFGAADPLARCARFNWYLPIRGRCYRHHLRTEELCSCGGHPEGICSELPSAFRQCVIFLCSFCARAAEGAFCGESGKPGSSCYAESGAHPHPSGKHRQRRGRRGGGVPGERIRGLCCSNFPVAAGRPRACPLGQYREGTRLGGANLAPLLVDAAPPVLGWYSRVRDSVLVEFSRA